MKNADPIATTKVSTDAPPVGGRPARRWHQTLGRDLLTILGLAIGCLCAGLVINQWRDQPLPLVYVSKQNRLQQAVAEIAKGGEPTAAPAHDAAGPTEAATGSAGAARVIDLETFHDFVQAKRGLVLDARPAIFHRSGHVPGALSLPRDGFEKEYARQRDSLETKRNQPIAVYCSDSSCEDSQMVADALVKLGYRQILVFKGGWGEWTGAGQAEERQ